MATISYGKVANTRHSVKHATGTVKRSRYAILAGNVHLCSSVSREEFLRREDALDERPLEYDFNMLYGEIVKKAVKKAKADVREHESDRDFKQMFKPFKPLKEPTVHVSAKGGFNSGTKDKSVTCTIAASPDVDNVSSMTGGVSPSHDGRHMTKLMPTAYNRERTAAREALNKAKRWGGHELLPEPVLLVVLTAQVAAQNTWKKAKKGPMPQVRGVYPEWANEA